MIPLFSPGSLVTIAGATLTVIGSIAYVTDSPNISLAGVFYGVPLLLGGLALKSSELPPARRLTSREEYRELRLQPTSEPLRKLLADVTRWRYGQKAHLESSLQVLNLWDDDDPPQLEAIEEVDQDGGYGLRLHFSCHGVPCARWREKQDRLGRFFGPHLRAQLEESAPDRLVLSLLPAPSPAPSPSGSS
jgi:hypothetical protein